MQSEILSVMAREILERIGTDIRNSLFYTVMCDELTDCANDEQLVIVIRWIDSKLVAHEEFVGLYKIENIEADTIFHAIKDVLIRMNLSFDRCRGQCYDGASNMSGHKKGVATQILALEKRVLFTNCYGHSLNLAANDAIKAVQVVNMVKDALDTTQEICKLIKFSPRRETLFDKIKSEITPGTPGVRVLCLTRWTVRADSAA